MVFTPVQTQNYERHSVQKEVSHEITHRFSGQEHETLEQSSNMPIQKQTLTIEKQNSNKSQVDSSHQSQTKANKTRKSQASLDEQTAVDPQPNAKSMITITLDAPTVQTPQSKRTKNST